MRTVGKDRTVRTRERAARAAIREFRDPGSDLRQEADSQARTVLATSTVNRWAPAVVVVAAAIACVVGALVKNDPAVAFPALVLAVLAVVDVLLRRRSEAMAERWLADPPVPLDEDTHR
jgi:Flp pilus assembly protein TadB